MTPTNAAETLEQIARDFRAMANGQRPIKIWELEQNIAACELGAAALRRSLWQPIESAPKDGTPILLVWHWDSGIHRGVSVVVARWMCRTHAHLSLHKACPNEPDCAMGWDGYSGEFTRWMPMPPVPDPPGPTPPQEERP